MENRNLQLAEMAFERAMKLGETEKVITNFINNMKSLNFSSEEILNSIYRILSWVDVNFKENKKNLNFIKNAF